MKRNSKSLLAAAVLCLTTTLAVGAAQAGDVQATPAVNDQAIRNAVKLINPKAEIKAINDFGMPGVKQVLADTSVVYISNDGRYVFSGLMLDMVEKRNLSDEAQGLARAEMLRSIPKSTYISFEPKVVKHRITVFTDVSCGYCQMLHKGMQSYLDAGIAIDYVPFPRGGSGTPAFVEMQSAWCAADRKKTLDAAFHGEAPREMRCDNPVAAMYELGDKLGIQGTPAIYDAEGHHLGGYVPADQMIKQLDQFAARGAASRATASTK
ncbi:thioredoxin fold domain-containing protein (plasmid) [Xanthomonas citri pv. citri]|uniref:thioredoxin fold domain-containing protein n=1 Tax=Xanthomonas citri TaxID=346 RepID=UPI001934141E|nr:thioredoxin fold domain-containing protein [Xanthomonas citri]QRD62696.1 thioredoxin fold domain-containing protein [Xanthomonas citri pv. citri]QRD67231.1 thioredoxin fold domain-containing protein [Xanthomonas citri pv. citri]QRD71724.1 thioredoxin fold domain-containing protein [Xanthomonas citri pv. citri]